MEILQSTTSKAVSQTSAGAHTENGKEENLLGSRSGTKELKDIINDTPIGGPANTEIFKQTLSNHAKLSLITQHEFIEAMESKALIAVPPPPLENGTITEGMDTMEIAINRALIFDSPINSEGLSFSSAISYQESQIHGTDKSTEEDNSSAWSMLVNTSTQGEITQEAMENEVFFCEPKDGEEDRDEDFGDLYKIMTRLRVAEVDNKACKFAGKHTRFIYNSDGEMEGEEEEPRSAGVSTFAKRVDA